MLIIESKGLIFRTRRFFFFIPQNCGMEIKKAEVLDIQCFACRY